MQKLLIVLVTVLVLSVLVVSCASTTESILPQAEVNTAPLEQLVWVGSGEYWEFDQGEWIRRPFQDYEFLVRQNRFSGVWESLKIQNRTHPEYDGVAGPADQQHFFRILFEESDSDDLLPVVLNSTYGNGNGWSDKKFQNSVLELKATGVSRFAPYNFYRITQNYDYEQGLLTETVELFLRKKDGSEEPFGKIEERARIFTNHSEY